MISHIIKTSQGTGWFIISDKLLVAKYRLEKAKETLINAKVDLANNLFSGAVNRSYYAIFYGIRAVLALEGLDSKKHSGVISLFREKYVKTGHFDAVFSDYIRTAFEIRQDSDYEDFYIVSIEEASEQLDNATRFIVEVEKFIKNQGVETVL